MGKRKFKRRSIIEVITLLTLFLSPLAWAGPPAVGEQLPGFTLPAPKDSAERGYLGLTFLNRSFRIPELKAELIIVQVFSMYCPYCQADAPHVNELFNLVEGNPKLRGKIKILGIGAGNSDFEVSTFKKKYQVPFPLFGDPDFRIHKLLGEVRTPYFIAVRIGPDKSQKIVLSRLGMISSADKFLAELLKLADLK